MTKEREAIAMEAVDWSLPLAELVKVLVAQVDHVKPEDVTNEYIQQKYDAGFASDLRYDKCSQYGGYSQVGLKFLSRDELREREKQADELLRK